jgi:hypothetical protein
MEENLGSELDGGFDDKVNKAFNFFWIGYIIYTVCFVFPASTKFAYFLCQGLQMVGLLFFVSASITIIQWKFSSNYLRIIFTFYCFWSLLVILRGFRFDYLSIKDILLNGWFGIFIYFAPFVLLFPKNVIYVKKAFYVIIILGFFYFFYDMLFYRVLIWGLGGNRLSTGTIEYFTHFLAIPCGFILLTYIYHKKTMNLVAIGVIILAFLLASIRARRGLMFMAVTILLASYIVYYFTNKGKILKVILSIFIVVFLVIYGGQVYSANRGGMFGMITGRMDEDTRTGVEEYFKGGMTTTDWVIGRGINGQYYCPGINELAGTVTIYRNVIETGYLQIILKGGIISLVLFLLLAVPAVFKGLFHSKNVLSKAAAIWILLFIIYLYPTTINSFSMSYLIIWFSIGICHSPDIRDMSDERIKALFSPK